MNTPDNSIIKNFSKGAEEYDRYNQIQTAVFNAFFFEKFYQLAKDLQPKAILDVGCGTGHFTKQLAGVFPESAIVGLDLSEGMIKQAKQNYPHSHMSFVIGDASRFSLDRKFDLVISNAVFQWVRDLHSAMESLTGHVEKNGRVLLSVFGPDTFWEYQDVLSEHFKVNIPLLASRFRSVTDFRTHVDRHFQDVEVTPKAIKIYYNSLEELHKSIDNTTGGQSSTQEWTPDLITKIENLYREKYGKIVVTADVFFVSARNPYKKGALAVPFDKELQREDLNVQKSEKEHRKSLNIQSKDYKKLKQQIVEKLFEACTQVTGRPQSSFRLTASIKSYDFESLTYARLAGLLNESLDVSITPVFFYEHHQFDSLVEDLAKLMGQKGSALIDQDIKADKPKPKKASVKHRKGRSLDDEAIAIIGMAGKLPQSNNLEEFWNHLKNDDDLITEIPRDRWDWQAYYGDPIHEVNKIRSKWGGFIKDIDKFDAPFFGISPREAKFMDPQQRLLLETVWKTIEDAGYKVGDLKGTDTGVFVGIATQDYYQLLSQQDMAIEAYTSTGTHPSIIANRISFMLDLQGPSEPIDTACSASLVAIHRAAKAIRNGECPLAIAGGINILLTPTLHMSFSKAGMLCEDGRCKTFSAKANGYVRSEGVGTVLLKPLVKAVADGDHIYGVIRGTAENHGGRTNSLTAPNPNAQAKLLNRVYNETKINPSTISYIECHGTGTELGDPIEIEGLKKAFSTLYEKWGANVDKERCGLGSVKSNIGHLESAAGIAGVFKVLLAMKYQELPASLHCQTINPYIELKGSPFYIVDKTKPWVRLKDKNGEEIPLRAGVSSFGFGGSNAHILIEEWPHRPSLSDQSYQTDLSNRSYPIVLSAKNEDRLKELVKNLYTFLTSYRHPRPIHLHELAFTLQTGREAMEERLGFIVGSVDQLTVKLKDFMDGRGTMEDTFRGRFKGYKDDLSLFAPNENLTELINSWVSKKNYPKLLQCWVKGFDFDWHRLYGEVKPRRMSLPTYPFAKERYWIPESTRIQPQGSHNTHHPPSIQHPASSTQHPASSIQHPVFRFQAKSKEIGLHKAGKDKPVSIKKKHQADIKKSKSLPSKPEGISLIDTQQSLKAINPDRLKKPAQLALRDALSLSDLSTPKIMASTHSGVSLYHYEHEGVYRIECAMNGVGQGSFYEGINKSLEIIGHDEKAYAVLLNAGSSSFFSAEFDPIETPKICRALLGCKAPIIAVMKGEVKTLGILLGLCSDIMLFAREGRYQYRWEDLEDVLSKKHQVTLLSRRLGEQTALEWVDNGLDCTGETIPVMGLRVLAESEIINELEGLVSLLLKTEALALQLLKQHLSQDLFDFFHTDLGNVTLSYPSFPEQIDPVRKSVIEILSGKHQASEQDFKGPYGPSTLVEIDSPVFTLHQYAEGILLVTMCDQESKNTFSERFVQGMSKVFEHIKENTTYKVVILTGYDHYFSCGGTKEGLISIYEGKTKFTDTKIYSLALECSIPVIAAMQGHGIGAGWAMGMFCDLPIFSKESVYVSNYMRFGFTPGAGATLILPYRFGQDLAREILFTAREYKGVELQKRGIGYPILPREKVLPYAMAVANKLATFSRKQLSHAKQLWVSNLRDRMEAIYKQELAMHERTFVGNTRVLERIRHEFNGKTPIVENSLSESISSAPSSTISLRSETDVEPLRRNPGSSAAQDLSSTADHLKHVQKSLRSLLAEELHMEPEDIHDDVEFLDLGLDSIAGVSWVHKINEKYGLSILATKVYNYPTIQDFSKFVVSECQQQGLFQEHAVKEPSLTGQASAQQPDVIKPVNDLSLQLSTLDRLKQVQKSVRSLLAEELHMKEEDILDDVEFLDLGLDSIAGVSWVRKINEKYGLSILATKVYNYPTMRDFSKFVVSECQQLGLFQEQNTNDIVSIADELTTPGRKPASTQEIHSKRSSSSVAPITQKNTVLEPDLPEEKETPAIAIVGMSGKFPKSKNVLEFWKAIKNRVDCISEVPEFRWNMEDYYDKNPQAPGKTYCKWMGVLEGIDQFDPLFFNISPGEAEFIDPQQRLFLEHSWACLEDAGYSPNTLSGSRCGVFVGCATSDYGQGQNGDMLNAQGLMGLSSSILSARISYFLNLQGPCLAIDTACSSSLVAIAEACNSLILGESDLALTGGVWIMAGPSMHIATSKAGMLSKDGRCFSFDRRANGFVPGEGVGAILLKRLEDARKDRDNIHGIIRGWGVNQDGKTNGITAPNQDSQIRLEKSVYDKAGINPEEIQLVEAHGTGTNLGDPIEVEALTQSFQSYTTKKNYCALGSVKSNIGHLLTAAGVAGVIKILMALKHRTLPPTIHFEQLNDNIKLQDTPFYVNTECKDWKVESGIKRRAAISSFGFSGTNAHLVIEEGPDRSARSEKSYQSHLSHGAHLIVLSAKNEDRLREMAKNLHDFINHQIQNPKSELIHLDDLAYTLQIGRKAMNERVGIIVSSLAELAEKLQVFISDAKFNSKDNESEIYRGQVKSSRDSLSVFADDEDMVNIIDIWIRKRKYSKLLELWVKGLNIDWTKLYNERQFGNSGPRRTSLPTYPFAKERYWITPRIHLGNKAVGIDKAASPPPLISSNVSDSLPSETDHLSNATIPGDEVTYLPRWEEQPELKFKNEDRHKVILVVYSASSIRFENTISGHYKQNRNKEILIQIQLSNQTKHLSGEVWECDINNPKGFATCLQDTKPIDCLYFMSSAPESLQPLDLNSLVRSQEANEIQLLRLVKFLKENDKISHVIDCYLLTIDNYRINGVPNPYGGGITGLGYSIAQGDHRFRVRNVDLSSEALANSETQVTTLKNILAEPPSDRGDVIKLKSGRRYKQIFFKLNLANLRHTSGLKKEGVYVILGGSGTVGSIITRYLLQVYDADVIWIGRKPETSAAVQEKIESLRGLGTPPQYLQADVTDLDAMKRVVTTIKNKYGPINGAIFSGVVFNWENSIEQTTEDEFRRILDVKTKGSLNFYTAFQKEPLDFMCYFSSGQGFSFSGAAKLSAYATGITFSDSFIQSIQEISKFPVGIINWGFWKSALETYAVNKHIVALEENEGFSCFECFSYLLQANRLNQILCLRASPEVEKLMGCNPTEVYSIYDKGPSVKIHLPDKSHVVSGDDVASLTKSQDLMEFRKWVAQLLFAQLRALGIFPENNIAEDRTNLRRKAGVIECYGRWWDECLDVLEKNGYVQLKRQYINVSKPTTLKETEKLWEAWDQRKAAYLEDPDKRPLVTLVDACLRRLPEILKGQIQATDILFPNSSMEKVEGIYKDNTLSNYFNSIVAEVITSYVKQRLEADPQTRIRIIEIGAGTGGTTSKVLPELGIFHDHIQEYCYTDISKAFLLHAEERYGQDCPYLTYKLWNIEQSLAGQEVEAGHYDIAIATNVLHATRNIRQTLRNAKAALTKNGLLIINELNQKTIEATVTFGLLDGWWLYEDQGLRIPGSPILNSESWQEALAEEGFTQIRFPAKAAHELGQQIIIAESDGIVRQNITTRPIQENVENEADDIGSMPLPPETLETEEGSNDTVVNVVLDALSKTLKISKESIEKDVPFSELGTDSILGVSFVSHINELLGIDMNTAIIFDYTSVDRLANYILDTFKDHITIKKAADINKPSESRITDSAKIRKPDPCQHLKTDSISSQQQDESFLSSIKNQNRLEFTDIAVVGVSGQFPAAKDISEFWENLVQGKDGICELPSHYLERDTSDNNRDQPGKSSYNWGGILAERDCFDPLFFHISPREAESMNPHQRLILQESWKALEDSGYNPKALMDSQVGIFIGAEPTGYARESFTGSSDALIASRLSYYLNLRGPAMVVNTGCSSSAVAIHLACESLRSSESDIVLAGGVFATMSEKGLVALSEIGMLSPTGQCHTFDKSSNGTVLSEGVGIVVLKRLKDAIEGGDSIYGVIQGTGVNQDGSSNGITAPNGIAQEALITDVYRRYQINPEEISYVEAHGTGTQLGDPVEANALARAFKQFTDKKHYCAIGSAKSHIGHTSAAAGVVSLIKVLLSLRHHKIPGLLHFKELNPQIELKDSPFYVNTESVEWRSKGQQPRMAALNSFGHSGTNVHLVLREYLAVPGKNIERKKNRGPFFIPLSAKDQDRLKEVVQTLHGFLKSNIQQPAFNIRNIAYTLQIGREAMEERVIFLVQDTSELMEQLQAFTQGKNGLDHCWKGQLDQNYVRTRRLFSKEETQSIVAKWISNGQFRKIAELWSQGFDIDWNFLYEKEQPKRIHLPTYPFAKERYGNSAIEGQGSRVKGQNLKDRNKLHPLVHENTSTLEAQRFTSTLVGDEFFLKDHLVKGEKVLPGVAYLEMAKAAVQAAIGKSRDECLRMTLKNVAWVRPITIQDQSKEVHIALFPENKGITYEIYTLPEGQDQAEPMVHSQGLAILGRLDDPAFLDFSSLKQECQPADLSPEKCYQTFQAMGLNYGKTYKGIREIYRGDGQVLAKLQLPTSIAETIEQFTLHPSLLDSALQASVGLIRGVDDTSLEIPKLTLPFALDELEILGKCTREMWAWIRYEGDSTSTNSLQKLDVDLCDSEGRICVRFKGFNSRALEGEIRSQHFNNTPVGTMIITPVWNAIPSQKLELDLNVPEAMLLIGGTKEEKAAIQRHVPQAKNLDIEPGDTMDTIVEGFQGHVPVEHIIWIAPDCSKLSYTNEHIIQEQNHGALHVFRIIKALLFLGYGNKDITFTFITTKAQAVRDEAVYPTHASVHGLVGSLANEYQHWNIRLFDLEEFPNWPLKDLFSLAADKQGNALVHRGKEWYRQELIPLKHSPVDNPPYRYGGVYVVIGGAGGIGTVWSRFLIAHYQAQIVWIGRREKDEQIQEKINELSALGPAPQYISANATDRKALAEAYQEIKQRYGNIQGVVHSAIVLRDQSLAGMNEESFKAGLSAKVDISVNMAQIFGEEPLEFMLFFSSIMAFAKTAGQSNYAAGSTFKDAFARGLARESSFTVKIINWGYWASVGIVTSPEYQERMLRMGLGSIEPEEGMEALNVLLTGPMDQIGLVKILKPSVLARINQGEWITSYPEEIPSTVEYLRQKIDQSSLSLSGEISGEGLQNKELEKLLCQILYGQLESLGLFSENTMTVAAAKKRVGWIDLYDRWFDESMSVLTRSEYLQQNGDSYEVLHSTSIDLEAVWQEWDRKKKIWLNDKQLKALVTLLEKVLRALPEILTGKTPATDIVFPNSSLELVEGIYKGNPISDYFNDALGQAIVTYLKRRLEQNSDVSVRILEIGAGTGGTTAMVLPKIRPFREHIADYCYTDLSQAFLTHAEKEYSGDNPFLTTAILDVEKPLTGQNIQPGRYDVVIATNVLHATKNIRETLRNAKATLSRHGLLVLNEMSMNPLPAHLTFGLLKGWWLYEDQGLRIPGSPALYPEKWQEVLRDEGFKGIFFPMKKDHDLGHQIIIAESDGVIRQKQRRQSPVTAEKIKNKKSPSHGLNFKQSSPKQHEKITDGRLREKTTTYIKKLVGDTLKIPSSKIESSAALEKYGIDSIVVIQLTNAMTKVFDNISSTLFFEYQTIDGLVDHFMTTRKEELTRLVGWEHEENREPFPEEMDTSEQLPAMSALRNRRRFLPSFHSSREALEPENNGHNDIAVIGLAGRYPQADNVDVFWENLKQGKNCITEIPGDRWDWKKYFNEEKGKKGTIYSKWGGFIGEIDKFDALFFHISPREAERMDPQERLFLETAYASIEDAGYTAANLCDTRKIGVFVGVMNGTYTRQSSYASIANRVSYTLNFQGPSMAVDSACSSSLTAIHLALESLYNGTSEIAIAGGVSLIVNPIHYQTLSRMTVLSPTDKCKSFGDQADGFVDGEGVGAIVLKPLAKAIESGDHIYGVIKGSMVNAGGKTNGYTVPNPKAQGQLISEALQRSGVNARSMTYVEAHGTGTVLGDPIEIAGLTMAFKENTPDKQFCAIGSAKSNIGHCESAAGIAGLTKILLQLKHRLLVPSLHSKVLNPKIDFAATPFVVNQELRPWEPPTIAGRTYPRRAGISSFGAGGSNAHVILEEYGSSEAAENRSYKSYRTHEAYIIVLSAKNPDRLKEVAKNLYGYLTQNPKPVILNLHEVAYTLQVGREAMEERLGFIVESIEELKENLNEFLVGKKDVVNLYRGQAKADQDTIAAFGADEDMANIIETWISRGKYSKLLDFWVKGLNFDWNTLYGDSKPARISLPTYPFAKERYWLDDNEDVISKGPSDVSFSLKFNGNDRINEQFHSSLLDRVISREIDAREAIQMLRNHE